MCCVEMQRGVGVHFLFNKYKIVNEFQCVLSVWWLKHSNFTNTTQARRVLW